MLKCKCVCNTGYRGTSLWYNIIITFNIIAYYVRILDNA